MSDYPGALAWIHSLFRFGMKPGLERTRELLHRLGDPHRAPFRIVHVTGTNGKGSTCAMVEAGLRAAGFRTGLYISPFLEDWRERIQVDGQPVAPEDVAALVAAVRPRVEAMVAAGHEQPTEFEVTTAMAFLHYARTGIDWLVLEVGLGGRYDATNVVAAPAATCITNISLDHVTVLGDTPAKIAWDKAGILKAGVPCVTAVRDPGALAVIAAVAAQVGAPLREVTFPAAPHARDLDGQTFDLPGLPGLRTSLLGDHQLANAACAAGILELCGVPEAAVRQGLAAAAWPGRFEVVRRAPQVVVLDGAHNEAGAAALARTVGQVLGGRSLTLVLGVLADKNVERVVGALAPLADRVIATTPVEERRALPAVQLLERVRACARPGATLTAVAGVAAAVDRGLEVTPVGGAVLITGSLYLVGPARTHLRNQGLLDRV